MKEHKFQIIIVFFLSIALFFGSAHSAELYKKKGFSISLPDGWIEVPRKIVDKYENEISKLLPEAPALHYDYVFQLGSAENWFEYPFIAIFINNIGKIPENYLEAMEKYPVQQEANRHKKELSPMMTDIQTGKMYYDKKEKIVWLRMESKINNIGDISGLSGLIPTEKGFIQVSGYSLKKDFPTYKPIFRSSAMSVEPSMGANSKWYKNGSLHEATVKEWSQASYENKLATAADWAISKPLIKDKVKNGSMDDLKTIAVNLVDCLNETTSVAAADKKYQYLEISPFADSCLIIMKGKYY